MNARAPHRIVTQGRFRIGSAEPLAPEQLRAIELLLENPGIASGSTLSGRGTLVRGELPGAGPVIVKRYARGGLLRHLLGRRYLRFGPTRGELEFEMLRTVRTLGVRAPEPVAFAYYGKLVVHAWLITKEVPGWTNLADLARSDEERVRAIGEDLTEQIAALVRAKVLHVDLHPGNIVVDGEGAPHIVDFDKARRFEGRANRLRDRYLTRWRRAVIKHELPELVSELICLGLRRNFES